MNYLEKPNGDFNSTHSKSLNFSGCYKKPAVCPYCKTSVDAPLIDRSVTKVGIIYMLSASCKCTACGKEFFFTCFRNKETSDIAENICIWPNVENTYKNEKLEEISERFIHLYNQALRAEANGDFELAGIGFRTALEHLVKDYAIKELKIDADEVSKKSLAYAIGEYLHQTELVNTADVVRIFGNDYTHYEEKHPEKDFKTLKAYMEIFLKLIETEYMIKHPPVAR